MVKKTTEYKNYIPRLPYFYIRRNRIYEGLKGNKSLYICAGMGYGKTTALSDYAKELNNVIWYNASPLRSEWEFISLLGNYFNKELSDEDELYELLSSEGEGLTIIIDDLEKAKPSLISIIKDMIILTPEVRFIIASNKLVFDVYDSIIYNKGSLIGKELFIVSFEEAYEICGVSFYEYENEIDGLIFACGLRRLEIDGNYYVNSSEVKRDYIKNNILKELSFREKSFLRDIGLTDKCPIKLSEYLYEGDKSILDFINSCQYIYKDDKLFRVNRLIKNAVTDTIGVPEDLVHKKILDFYEANEDYRGYLRYCIASNNKESASRILDKRGVFLIDSGSFDILDESLNFIGTINEGFFGIDLVKGGILALKGDYTKSYPLLRRAYEFFRNAEEDIRYIYSAYYTARVLRESGYKKEALSVIKGVERVNGINNPIYEYMVMSEKVLILSDMGEEIPALEICFRGINKNRSNGVIARLYQRLSVRIFYTFNRIEEAEEAFINTIDYEGEYYWIKKRCEVNMYGFSSEFLLGDRTNTLMDFEDNKEALIKSGIIDELWLYELHYLKVLLYEYIVNSLDFKNKIKAGIRYIEGYLANIEGDNKINSYLSLIKSILEANEPEGVLGESINKAFERLDDRLPLIKTELLCIYSNILMKKRDISGTLLISDRLIGDKKTAFSINTVMKTALFCYIECMFEKCDRYIEWIGGEYDKGIDLQFLDISLIKTLMLICNSKEIWNNLNMLYFSCALGKKPIYAKTFHGYNVLKYCDDAPIKWRTGKSRDIMAYLVYMDGSGVTKNRIIENLWGGGDSKEYTAVFNTNIYNLRKALEVDDTEGVIFSDNLYYIDREAVGSDYSYFMEAWRVFRVSKTVYNALIVLAFGETDIFSNVEGAFIPELKRECQKIIKSALKEVLRSEKGDRYERVYNVFRERDNIDLSKLYEE